MVTTGSQGLKAVCESFSPTEDVFHTDFIVIISSALHYVKVPTTLKNTYKHLQVI